MKKTALKGIRNKNVKLEQFILQQFDELSAFPYLYSIKRLSFILEKLHEINLEWKHGLRDKILQLIGMIKRADESDLFDMAIQLEEIVDLLDSISIQMMNDKTL